jgi:hypothetical protein
MTTDLDPYDVVDADLVDDTCADAGHSRCPGPSVPAQWMPDPYDADANNTDRLVYLHPQCATERALDI